MRTGKLPNNKNNTIQKISPVPVLGSRAPKTCPGCSTVPPTFRLTGRGVGVGAGAGLGAGVGVGAGVGGDPPPPPPPPPLLTSLLPPRGRVTVLVNVQE